MSSTQAPAAEFQNAGKPIAFPSYLVDQYGQPLAGSDGLPVTITNTQTLGQQTSANSVSIVPASDAFIRNWPYVADFARLGQVFIVSYSSGGVTGGSGKYGMVSVFNPSGSGKTLIIPSAQYFDTSAASGDAVYMTTSDPLLGSPSYANVVNFLGGSGGQVFVGDATYSDPGTSPPGTYMYLGSHDTSIKIAEILSQGAPIVLPAGVASGFLLAVSLSAATTHYWVANILVVQM
jgi:hypothetical protein